MDRRAVARPVCLCIVALGANILIWPRLGRYGLADLHEVAVGISKEAADLAAPIMRRGEEGRAPRCQCRIGCLAVGNPQRHGVTDQIRVSRRPER